MLDVSPRHVLPEWQALQALARSVPPLRSLLAQRGRSGFWPVAAPEVQADVSLQRLDAAVQAALLQLAEAVHWADARASLFAGERVNASEGRAALHMALRAPQTEGSDPLGLPALACQQALQARRDMLALAEQIRHDPSVRQVVNLGIGGSDLGPQMVARALQGLAAPAQAVHFVANGDPAELLAVLARCEPAHTLFIVSSKSFTTAETMANAQMAKQWLQAHGQDAAARVVGVTAQVQAAQEFGCGRVLSFPDWVGGRYSVWGPVGLAAAVALGAEAFNALLAGARSMDEHFVQAPAQANLPLQLALLDVWNRSFLGLHSRCVAPYASALARLPAHLQQLEMESNGKQVNQAGGALPYPTAALVWGEPGSNGQHAFFQALHQGADVVPVEFITVGQAPAAPPGLQALVDQQHRLLRANAAAQARALAEGDDTSDPFRRCPGNRPSTTLHLQALTPRSLGALLALYEHRVYCAATLWGINPFDQFGVELGKRLCNELLEARG
jgi:glucose-6-phosphate isomerase